MIIKVELQQNSYDIILERGALNNVQKYFDLNRKVLVVTDTGVPKEYAEAVASRAKESYVVTVDEGEHSKSFKEFERLLTKLLELGFTRSDCVVAVGGGVVGDLSGFVAASFMRGIDFYNIPTTVLSQVDSSIGGKVAIDLLNVKNIVGAFYQPKCVLIDPEVLRTLPSRQISNGLAEAVKMGLTSDKDLFELFENDTPLEEKLDLIIERSLKVKRAVVEVDEKENGLRRVLNFGHTLGHGIESAIGLDELYHGECVALGMIPMCSPSVKKRLIPVLKSLNLPTSVRCDGDAVIDAIGHDKKSVGSGIKAIFVDEVSSFKFESLTKDDFKSRLSEVIYI